MRVLVVVVVVRFDRRCLDLRRRRGRRRARGLTRSRGGEVGLLLARVQHHRRSGGRSSSRGRGGVLLDRVDGRGGAGVLQVMLGGVVVVVEVRRREMR